ncbi:PREDICTED: transcription factor LHW-like isoform X1 [Camelina sativa]|uniref:Transcription factor LHW-like isoform X1 n=2 Tax=Camelina sativa TaxID=90675 RepID=A0ABM1RR54_CAMSA|nr:PREDICTED: transcription factor LHW-like isoform X1 [Camelina sativa]XP_019101492.1 PREDICTED: transcription factor LHW-like isoform X1 [Camelina sativa]
MGVLLQEALRSMCVNNQWCYAVFWKIGCQNSSLLIWEECYNDTASSSHPRRVSGLGIDAQGNDKVQLLTNRMMLNNRIILVGEGLVGRAAFTGHHQWILANSFNRDVHPPEVINEMLLQFSAGIQTVAVFPVVPHGVVQLGSSLPIMENLGFVNDVKALILQLGCVPGALLSENYRTYEPAADFIGVPVSRMIPSQGHKILQSSAFVAETSKPHFNSTGSSDQMVEEAPSNIVDEQIKQANLRDRNEGGWQNTMGYLTAAEVAVPSTNPDAWLNQNFSCMSNVDAAGQQLQCDDISSKRSLGSDDLFDMLGLDDKNKGCDNSWGVSQMRTDVLTRELSDFRIIQEMDPEFVSSGYELSGTDHLLDAVVSGACSSSKQISDETSESCKTTLTKVSNSSVTTPSHSSPQGSQLFEKKHVQPPGPSSVYGSQISSWVEQAHSLKREDSPRMMNKNETAKPTNNRKRLKPGENPRPRPKDRQMIQDRVKELREIIPNGAKCSIDALLERTIKHMLFLQNVSKHADKLKHTGESKILKEEGGGATWAFEVGSKSMVCPIVVEDVNPPRIFQVEMLCEQRGFFLEIADWIRSLGLTILKGVIETRIDKIWARFTVEASRDVTRMEIFMQLVNILEQTMKCGGNSKTILDGIKATMPLPVTGGCSM